MLLVLIWLSLQEYELSEHEVKITLDQFRAKFVDENGDIMYAPFPFFFIFTASSSPNPAPLPAANSSRSPPALATP